MSRENPILLHANNKSNDQPAQPARNLVNVFLQLHIIQFHILKSAKAYLAQILQYFTELVYVAVRTGLRLTCSQNRKQIQSFLVSRSML